MKLNKKQFCTAVRTYESMLREEKEITESLDIAEWKPGEWVTAYYELLSEMCELDEDPNMGTDLDWYCFETDFGRRAEYCVMYDVVADKQWTINTPEKLYDFITRKE